MRTRRYLKPVLSAGIALLGAFVLLLAGLWLGGARSNVLVRNGDSEEIESCTIRVQSEFDLDQVRTFRRLRPGAVVTFTTRRLDESAFLITCRYAHHPELKGFTGNVWDPAPGDTTWIELRRTDFVVDDPNGNARGHHEWVGYLRL